uniref:Uncharacterized protein n=1 Tax=Oreochromis niloticus TaxID=8128 RepID=A0A669EI51_ORENI
TTTTIIITHTPLGVSTTHAPRTGGRTRVKGNRRLNDAVFQFSHISHSTQEHLKKVYSSLAICMCLAAVGSYVYIYLVARLVTVSAASPLAVLGLLICLATERKRLAFLEGFAFALYDTHRGHLFLRGTLMSGCSILFLVSLTNVFFGSTLLFEANTYLGLLLIIEKAENGDEDYIWHCVTLFDDFISIFRRLMIILYTKEKAKKTKTVSERILCKIIPTDSRLMQSATSRFSRPSEDFAIPQLQYVDVVGLSDGCLVISVGALGGSLVQPQYVGGVVGLGDGSVGCGVRALGGSLLLSIVGSIGGHQLCAQSV